MLHYISQQTSFRREHARLGPLCLLLLLNACPFPILGLQTLSYEEMHTLPRKVSIRFAHGKKQRREREKEKVKYTAANCARAQTLQNCLVITVTLTRYLTCSKIETKISILKMFSILFVFENTQHHFEIQKNYIFWSIFILIKNTLHNSAKNYPALSIKFFRKDDYRL